jgi:ribonuclease HI
MFYKTESKDPASHVVTGPLTLGKQERVKAHYAALGELDMRVAAGAMALSQGEQDWRHLLPYVRKSQPVEEEGARPAAVPKPRHLHWLFAEQLRSAIEADQFVGSPPTVCSFGFGSVVTGTEASPLTRELQREHTVVWLNGYRQDKAALMRQLNTALSQSRVLVVMSYGLRQLLCKDKLLGRWCKVRSFPGTPVMLSANQFEHTPKASARVLEVWANRAAWSHLGDEHLQRLHMPEDPLLAIHGMTGGRWQQFHEGSQDFKYREFQGVVAATDGSVVNDPQVGPLMGGGIAFRAGDHGLEDQCVCVHGHVSTLVAEGAAAATLLAMVPKDKPLVIFTDSANIMYAMQHCSRKERWRDFATHPDVELLTELALQQAGRTALTIWVKIKSHTSVELNERADRLATEAPFAEESTSKKFDQQEDSNLIQFYKKGDSGPVQATAQELKEHFLQIRSRKVLDQAVRIFESDRGEVVTKVTRTVQKLTAVGVGREFLPTVVWADKGPYSVEDKVVKRMLQCITNTFPTQARLHIMGKASDGTCKFCSGEVRETLFHWQSECSRFNEARTKAHNIIWSTVFEAMSSYLPKGPSGWDTFFEIPVKDIFSSMQNNEEHALRRPDGVFLQKGQMKYVLVDLTRGYGSTREALAKQEATKRAAYAGLMQALDVAHMVEFFPLACGYNGAIAVDTWRALMDRLDIPPAAQDRVFKLAIRAICISFSTMVDIRHGCFRATEQSSQPR